MFLLRAPFCSYRPGIHNLTEMFQFPDRSILNIPPPRHKSMGRTFFIQPSFPMYFSLNFHDLLYRVQSLLLACLPPPIHHLCIPRPPFRRISSWIHSILATMNGALLLESWIRPCLPTGDICHPFLSCISAFGTTKDSYMSKGDVRLRLPSISCASRYHDSDGKPPKLYRHISPRISFAFYQSTVVPIIKHALFYLQNISAPHPPPYKNMPSISIFSLSCSLSPLLSADG